MQIKAIQAHRKTEEWTLLAILMVSIIGIAITNLTPLQSYRYWTFSLVFYALSGMVMSISKRKRDKTLEITNTSNLIDQSLLWAGVLFAILSVYILIEIGRINYEASGFILLLILGLGVFIDGINISWRYSLTGMYLMFSAVITAYITAYMWIVIGAIVLLAFIGYLYEKHHYKTLLNHYQMAKKD